jgi:sterol 14-demethylase
VDVLMKSSYRDGSPIPDDHIKGILIGLLFAGQHTSSITATWTGLMLLSNPAYYKRVMDEQRAVLAEFNGDINFDSLKKVLFVCL